MCDRPWIKWSGLLRRVQSAKIRIRHNVTFYTCFLSCYIHKTVTPRGSRHESKTLPFVSQPNLSPKNLQRQQPLLPGDSEEMLGSTSYVKTGGGYFNNEWQDSRFPLKNSLSLSLSLSLSGNINTKRSACKIFQPFSKFSKVSDSKHGLTDAVIKPRLKNVHQNVRTRFQDFQTHFDWMQNPFSVQQVAIYFHFWAWETDKIDEYANWIACKKVL